MNEAKNEFMNILVTGAKGFVGQNLVENLKNLRDGKNRTRPGIKIKDIFEYDLNNSLEQLDAWCSKANFVFNLAGVNRPKDLAEFRAGNYDFASLLLDMLKKHGNTCPVMLSSSIQASLTGRFSSSEYGLSKRKGEELFFRYAEETGAEVYVYRFPNIVGKWVRPNYNSAVGTFCHNIAHDLPLTVNEPGLELELLFIDDLIEEMYDALEGHPHRCAYPKAGEAMTGSAQKQGGDEKGHKVLVYSSELQDYDGLTPQPCANGRYCYVPVTHKVTLGRIVELLHEFHEQPQTLIMPAIPKGSLEKKLYSMYLSYLPKEKAIFDLEMNNDDRGSFTELLKTAEHGQFSVNIIKPGITRGHHWHNSKWEFFVVVSGHGLIRERKIGTNPSTGGLYEPMEFEVSGEHIQAVYMLPGYTHSIMNLSTTENLVTLMWANEIFDPEKPDTFREPV